MPSIDLNADLAEGFGVWELGDDDAMLDIVTSANLACGFHAGNPVGLARTCRAAVARGCGSERRSVTSISPASDVAGLMSRRPN